ncbi:MAG: hypothetical protein R3B09_19915 [Nannocystaceae bacterium]
MIRPHRSSPALRLLVGVAAVAALSACQRRNTSITPNRVLDRPADLVLACVNTDGDAIYPTSADQCADSMASCGTLNSNQLIGLIANSERNEVAMFRQCAGSLVDMDPEAPGYQFIPVGALPTSLTATGDSCLAMVANVGSCDLSVLDVPALSAVALEVEVDGEPSSRVTTVTPRRADGTPLASRPGQILAVPRELSAAESIVGAGGIDVTGGTCDPTRPTSVYVTFPACQLVAEVDVKTERILQSRRFITDAGGAVTVIDAGNSPTCPVECPEQFEDGVLPDPDPDFDSDLGVFPASLALVVPPTNLEEAAPEDLYIEDATLFVGGAGSDYLIEIPIADRTLDSGAMELELAGASGVLGIRPTPVMTIADGGGESIHQFLYVIAGDGSTRVVRRNLAETRSEIGIECDTQVDPTLVTETVCDPAAYPGDNPPDRRPFADGPGIRAPGATITDWSFQRVSSTAADDPSVDPDLPQNSRFAFVGEGVVGVGVTSRGRIVLANFGQFLAGTVVQSAYDPLQLFSIELLPHSLWPTDDPAVLNPAGVPRMEDKEPARALGTAGSEANDAAILAPSLRRIDLYYSDACPGTSDCDRLVDLGGSPIENADGFGNLSLGEVDGAAGLYKSPTARVIPRDYQSWRTNTWALRWESDIPGTESSTGQLLCDEGMQSESGAYCFATTPDGSRLRDDAAAFCDAGVLPGDKLFIYGCNTTDDCGPGQICLRDEAKATTSGVCVSASTFDDPTTRSACWDYIHDPCGSPIREFLITRSTQTELSLQALDLPEVSVTYREEGEAEDAPPKELITRLVCAEEQPDGGCEQNADCAEIVDDEGRSYPYCYDGVCRRPCEEGEDCVLRRLPGPRCFQELVRYQVRAHNAFIVEGPGRFEFIADRVKIADDGSCYEDAEISSLLTSRIRLGRDEDDTRHNALWPIANCPSSGLPDTGAPNPCFIPDVRPALVGANSAERIFHRMVYVAETEDPLVPTSAPVPAIRFSNPAFSLVLDLTSLEGLVSRGGWRAEYRDFKRARISRGYAQSFGILTGYTPRDEPALIGQVPLVGPVRVVNAPELGRVYVVDAAGRGGSAGIRGQVMYVNVAVLPVLASETFIVR